MIGHSFLNLLQLPVPVGSRHTLKTHAVSAGGTAASLSCSFSPLLQTIHYVQFGENESKHGGDASLSSSGVLPSSSDILC